MANGKGRGRRPAIGVGHLTRLNPAAKEASCEQAEFSVRVIDRLGLQVAGSDEGFIERDSPRRSLAANVAISRPSSPGHETSFLAPVDEAPRLQGRFDILFHWIPALDHVVRFSIGRLLYAS